MKELKSFSALPNYFSLYMKNKECIELLFELLAGLPDESNSATEIPKPSSETNSTTTSNKATDKLNASGSKKWEDEE